MDKFSISIIIPVYNAEQYIERCIASILCQDFDSYEVILVDDGSTDASSLICDRYSSTDARFRVLHKANAGVSAARNDGVNLAQGEYLMFVDSDDELLPGALSAMYADASGADICFGGFERVSAGVAMTFLQSVSAVYKQRSIQEFLDLQMAPYYELFDSPWAKLFRRKFVERNGLKFDERLSYAEDKIFVFNALVRAGVVSSVSSAVYRYYMNPGTLSRNLDTDRHISQLLELLPIYREVILRLKEKYPLSEAVRRLYHDDLVARYVMRICGILSRRRSDMLDAETLTRLSLYVKEDPLPGLRRIALRRYPDYLLMYRGSVRISLHYFTAVSSLMSIFAGK